MAKSPGASVPPENRLLARLPRAEYQRLVPHLHQVPLTFKQVLYEPRSRIDYVYFPGHGVISAVTVMESGSSIEVATIGKEGMAPLTAFIGDDESPNRLIVQVPDDALAMKLALFRAESQPKSPLWHVMVRYHTAFQTQMSQAVACNGLHHIQERCCRWVLMTHDRVGSDEFPLTHEFLSHMLGVRRVSVTEVLKPLQEAGLILNRRGRITILNRKGLEAASCECYRSVQEEFDRLLGPLP